MVPIQSLVVRDIERKPGAEPKPGEPRDEEGVYLMDGGKAKFQAIKTGLLGELNLQVVDGLTAARRSSPARSAPCAR